MLKKLLLMGTIPLASIIVFALLESLGLLTPIEHRAYDLALAARPDVPENPHLLLIAADDVAIEKVGTWPWPRNYMAQGLLLMREFGASQALFDILYEEPSPRGINDDKYAGVAETYDAAFRDLKDYFQGLSQSLLSGQLPVREWRSAATGYVEALDAVKTGLLENLTDITVDRDLVLGNAARAFGKSFFAINVIESESAGGLQKVDTALLPKFFIKNASISGGRIKRAMDVKPPIGPVIQGVAGLGFATFKEDEPDGIMRRINLAYALDSRAVPQLGLALLLSYLGDPAVEIKPDAVVLKGALLPSTGKQTDITIPLAEDGTMLINWPKKRLADSFQNLSFWYLLEYDQVEQLLVDGLQRLAASEAIGSINVPVSRGPSAFLDNYYAPLLEMKKKLLSGGGQADWDTYRAARDKFVSALDKFLAAGHEEEVVRSIEEANESVKKEMETAVRKVFRDGREVHFPRYRELRALFQDKIKGAVCFTSWTANSTTDFGATPFVEHIEKVVMHMAMVNTILERQFLDDTPAWVSIVITAVFTLLVYFLLFSSRRPLVSVLTGTGTLVVLSAGLVLFFVLTGVYIRMVAPIASTLLVFIVFTTVKYLSTAKEKNFVRHAFSTFVSKEVLNELVADPSKFNLGGEQKRLTALFTDIKGFSGFSEKLDPPKLVRLLNGYFTDMANIILDLKGYLDKYVGDAIVSFFGAPTGLERPAHSACLAAVRMKRAEKAMNEHLMKEKLAPKPLLTRIGINTGEMLVGNMGSQDKFNYTIMGHHVNLASRLEGVNKQYGTWILISENTMKEGGAGFLTRRLDRVRVVGISKPVRLYELIEERSHVRPELFELVEVFHQGLEKYEKRDWDAARALFKEALKLKPDDAPSELYLARCLEFRKKPPAADWDGVFSLTSK